MSEIEKIESVVSEHAISIALMAEAVSSIKALLTTQTDSIKEIEKAMKSQELLMEKLGNLDNRMTDSVNRLHKRIDKNETDLATLKLEHATACDIVKPMAQKGASVHTGMVYMAKGLAYAVGAMMLGIIVWAIQQGAVK